MAEVVGYIAAFFTVIGTLPQLVKTLRTKSAGDVSVYMFVFMISGTGLWAIYGFMMNSNSIIMANLAAATVVAVNLIYKIKYNK